MEGWTLVIFLVCGAITFYGIGRYFLFGPERDVGWKAIVRMVRTPIYYFFGYECACHKKFLFGKKYKEHIDQCHIYWYHKNYPGSLPRF